MKALSVLALILVISIAFSCATPQPKGRIILVGTQRAHLNGFGEITGRVFDPKWQAFLPGANVVLLDTKLAAATNYPGVYKISNVPPGLYTIKVDFIG